MLMHSSMTGSAGLGLIFPALQAESYVLCSRRV